MAAAMHRTLVGRVVSARAPRSRCYARSFRKSSPSRVWARCCSPCKCGTRTTVSNSRQTFYTADKTRCGNTHSVLLTRRRLARRSCQCRDGRGQSVTTTAGRCKLLGRSREPRARRLAWRRSGCRCESRPRRDYSSPCLSKRGLLGAEMAARVKNQQARKHSPSRRGIASERDCCRRRVAVPTAAADQRAASCFCCSPSVPRRHHPCG
jgi:hypothetical protein